MMKFWYAVEQDEEDQDWGTGSYNQDAAKKMAAGYPEGRIAVIEEGADPVCVRVIKEW